jgi:putative transposase
MRAPRAPNTVDRGHVIRLDPTVKSGNALARACGVRRFTYNWALAEWNRQHAAGEKPTAQKLKKQFNAIKGEQFPWILESPSDANRHAFADLGCAFSNFFASCAGKRKGRKIGRPTFRCRGIDDSFYVANDKFEVRQRGKRGIVRLPVIGDIRMMEPLRWQGKILCARVFRKADQWFIAINVETRVMRPHVHERPIVGIDLGLKTTVVPSHGDSIDGPKSLRKDLKHLARANRELHRRKKGSKNRNKSQIKVARKHQRIANVRKDWWHKTTTDLCRKNQTVVIEDLRINFMLKNRWLARAASDAGLGMFKPLMLYKTSIYGTTLIIAAWNYPSTQRCSCCGHIKTDDAKIGLGVLTYVCDKCGFIEDRDRNGALNLEQYPGLQGNWSHRLERPRMIRPLLEEPKTLRISKIVEVETRP